MNRALTVLFSLSLFATAVAEDPVKGSGAAKTETREVKGFDKVELLIPADVKVKIGKPTPITIEADDNILPLIKTDVHDGRLVISAERKYSTKNEPDIAMTVTKLRAIKVSGSGDIKVQGLANTEFEVEITGSADIHVAGKSEKLAVTISGSADLFATDLEVRTAVITITGSGDAKVNVTEMLNAVVTGSGDVHYKGDPEVQSTITGGGSVQKAE